LGKKEEVAKNYLLFFCNPNFLIFLKPSPQKSSSPKEARSQKQKGRGLGDGLGSATNIKDAAIIINVALTSELRKVHIMKCVNVKICPSLQINMLG
jgi:hypothetical protein